MGDLDAAGLELLLRQWGYYYGEPIRDHPRRVPSSLLHRTREFAPGKADKRQAKGRAGFDRRRIMGKAAGLVTKDGRALCIPEAFVDPVPAPKKHNYGFSHERTVGPAPLECQRLNREVNELGQHSLLRELCLRAQYCIDGARTDRCDWITAELRKVSHWAEQVSESKFKNELTFAKVWLLARMTDPRRATG
jgi:hypothetical protein